MVFTFRQFLQPGERFASYRRSRLKTGDRVAIMLENRAEFMIARLAVVVANRAALGSINRFGRDLDADHIAEGLIARLGDWRRLQPGAHEASSG